MRKFLILAALSLGALVSCKDEQIHTYRVASDSTSENPAPPAGDSMGAAPKEGEPHAAQSVVWQAPGDWKQEAGGQFLTAAYALPSGGRVTVSKLGGDGGGLAANINRWRGQLGFKPLAENEVTGQPLKIADSKEEMLLFNLTAENAADDAQGIFAAILPLNTETWYFKFSGPVAVLKKSEGVFMAFLQTVRIAGSEKSAATPVPTPGPGSAKKINVTPPDGWTPSEGSSMRAASYSIAGPDGTSADVSVVPIPGDAGSVLDNVNRWRSQLQLAPLTRVDEPSAGEIFTSHMISTEPIVNGKKAAIGAAILKRPGMTWFFKITGEASLVEANLEKFDSFVRSATFPE